MPEYIDADEITRKRTNKYPWEEWEKTIPEGKAIDVTEIVGPAVHFWSSRSPKAAMHGLRVASRGGRAYVIKDKQS